MRTNTKAIIVNTPHNPTGYLMSREDYVAVHNFARENNLLLFSDEVYRESSMTLQRVCPPGVIWAIMHFPGRDFQNLWAGWSAHWLGCHKEQENLRKDGISQDYTTICNSAPSEFLAEVACEIAQNFAERSLVSSE